MNKTTAILSIVFLLLTAACGKQDKPSASPAANSNGAESTTSTSSPVSTATAAGTNQPAGQGTAAQSSPRLLGTYEIAEVHSGGVINILTQAKTTISFFADGTYSRISQEPRKVEHSDAGEYRTDGDKLVLMIKMSQGKIFNPPREISHTFELSPDGEELKLTSSKGNVAIFHRKSKKG